MRSAIAIGADVLSPTLIALRGRERAHKNSAEARSEKPDLYSADGQDDGDADDLVQSGRSRGKSWCSR